MYPYYSYGWIYPNSMKTEAYMRVRLGFLAKVESTLCEYSYQSRTEQIRSPLLWNTSHIGRPIDHPARRGCGESNRMIDGVH